MIEYHAHVAVLEGMRQALVGSGGDLGDISQTVTDHKPMALLGSLLDRLLEHSGDSDAELHLLARASGLWKRISDYIAIVAEVRTDLESYVLDPYQPGVLDGYNALVDRLHNELKPQYTVLVADLQAFLDELKPLGFIREHGQASDAPVWDWAWRDLSLSRRTGALVTQLLDDARASGDPELEAFAYGAIAGYAGNAIGSTYVANTVGGSRRSHRQRERLSANTIGAWLRQHQPGLTTTLSQLAADLRFGPPMSPALPQPIRDLIEHALDNTYAALGLPLPDVKKGYTNLLRHLELLSTFNSIPIPLPIDNTLTQKSNESGIGVVTLALGGGGGGSPTPDDTASDDGFDASDIPWWAWVLFAVCVALVAACYLLGICSPPTKDPYPGPFQHDGTSDTSAALTTYLTSDEALVSVNTIFTLHLQLYDAAMTMLKAAKLAGLVYPECPADYFESEFKQFTAVTPAQKEGFPHRPITQPSMFPVYPTSPIENLQTQATVFGPGSDPNALLFGTSTQPKGAVDFGLVLWRQSLGQAEDFQPRHANLNLDGDRGEDELCWAVDPGGSISDDPVPASALGYGDI